MSCEAHTLRPPPPPLHHQVSEFFTLADMVASLDMQNLFLINQCGGLLIPDPVHLPLVAFVRAGTTISIKTSL